MPRRRSPEKRKILPDPKYKDIIVAKFMNHIMKDGKKSVAEKIVYGAFNKIDESAKTDPVELFKKALDTIGPMVEVKSRRVGGATYQVPVEVREERRIALALRWIVLYSAKRSGPGNTMKEKMAAEDDARRGEERTQALTDQNVGDVDKALAAKEAELMEI